MATDVTDRSDLERLRVANHEVRSAERLRAHFDIERALSARLLASDKAERSSLYGEVYGELFASVADHPQHKIEPEKRRYNTARQVAFLQDFLAPGSVFVELGCGDAAVARGVAPSVEEAIAVDVTPDLVDTASTPPNLRFLLTNGTDLDLPSDTADVVYSNQLMEHLHPDDAGRQVLEIRRVLKPGGIYICSTPNRITGPHDISGYFAFEPSGLHLREYTHTSLARSFRHAGFASSKACIVVKGRKMLLPIFPVSLVESLMLALPRPLRARVTCIGAVRNLAGVLLIGRK